MSEPPLTPTPVSVPHEQTPTPGFPQAPTFTPTETFVGPTSTPTPHPTLSEQGPTDIPQTLLPEQQTPTLDDVRMAYRRLLSAARPSTDTLTVSMDQIDIEKLQKEYLDKWNEYVGALHKMEIEEMRRVLGEKE